ncbi:MAG: hypothetical protein LBH11_00735 [Propionibacteriaceae bacterium]|jgi:hypothetical protein|nr:hypothetical protein [Propionibacteriaceae bacterium]
MSQQADAAAFQALTPQPMARARFRALVVTCVALAILVGFSALYAPRVLRPHLVIGYDDNSYRDFTYSGFMAMLACDPEDGAVVMLESFPVSAWGWPSTTVTQANLTAEYTQRPAADWWEDGCQQSGTAAVDYSKSQLLEVWLLPQSMTDTFNQAVSGFLERHDPTEQFNTSASYWVERLNSAGLPLDARTLPQTLAHEQHGLLVVLSVGYNPPLHSQGVELTARSIFGNENVGVFAEH